MQRKSRAEQDWDAASLSIPNLPILAASLFRLPSDTFGTTLGIAHFGLLSSWFDPDAPPAVVGLALGVQGGTAVDFAGRVGSGEQLRSLPLIAANTLSVRGHSSVSGNIPVATNGESVATLTLAA